MFSHLPITLPQQSPAFLKGSVNKHHKTISSDRDQNLDCHTARVQIEKKVQKNRRIWE